MQAEFKHRKWELNIDALHKASSPKVTAVLNQTTAELNSLYRQSWKIQHLRGEVVCFVVASGVHAIGTLFSAFQVSFQM